MTWMAGRRDNCRILRRISWLLMPVLLVTEFLAGCGGDSRDDEHPLCAALKDGSVAITDSQGDTKNTSAAEILAPPRLAALRSRSSNDVGPERSGNS